MPNARLFEHNNFGGRQLLVDNPASARYLLATFGFLNELHFNDITSSVRLGANPNAPFNMCFLFQDARFSGNFKCFAYNANRDINALPGFNDQTSSVLLVSHDPTPRRSMLNIRQLAGSRINAAIDERLRGVSEVSRNGDVLLKFVIDVFEINQFGNDLVKIEVPIKIHTPWPFSDYNAKIGYYVDLFITAEHLLQGTVVGWWYWIEGGILTGSIESRLRPQVINAAPQIEAQLNTMLRELNWHRWTDVYLLPGASSGIDQDYDGNIADDCTIVLPFRE